MVCSNGLQYGSAVGLVAVESTLVFQIENAAVYGARIRYGNWSSKVLLWVRPGFRPVMVWGLKYAIYIMGLGHLNIARH